MPYNRVHVRAFMNAGEIGLFESSLGDSVKTLGAADLKRRIERTRRLRDKSRDLLRRQKIATRSRTGTKSGRSGTANERTAKKAAALDETLKRFEAQQARLDAAAAKGASRKAAIPTKRKGTTAGATPAAASAKAKSKAKAGAAKKAAPAPKATAVAKRPKKRPAAVVLREALQKKHEAEAVRNAALRPERSSKAPLEHGETALAGLAATPPDVRAAVVESRLQQANMAQIQGHSSTQVRRSQSKRDRRGSDA